MMKASEVIAATKAAIADFDFTGVTTDSRAVKPGELFVALKGGNFDGHDYCVKAAELGAAGVVVSHDVEGLPAGVSVFKVEDTLLAYQQLAHAYRLK
ncbi:Mur ligase domain-containing protein, partial [Phascolarctobacterium succinatutens]